MPILLFILLGEICVGALLIASLLAKPKNAIPPK